MKFIKFLVLVLVLVLCTGMFTTGCSTLNKTFGAEQEESFDAKAEAINKQAIDDYTNSVITIFQRDKIRSLICDFQTAHNKRVAEGKTQGELQAEFIIFEKQVQAVYEGGLK